MFRFRGFYIKSWRIFFPIPLIFKRWSIFADFTRSNCIKFTLRFFHFTFIHSIRGFYSISSSTLISDGEDFEGDEGDDGEGEEGEGAEGDDEWLIDCVGMNECWIDWMIDLYVAVVRLTFATAIIAGDFWSKFGLKW